MPPDEARLDGALADEGYGHRVLRSGGADWVGAPFADVAGGARGGRVYRDGSLVAEGEPGALLGAALAALDDGTVLIGAPGAGEVRGADGVAVWGESGAGGVLAARGSAWVLATATGARTSAGVRLDWGARPDALALLADGTVVAGFARGDIAVRLGDAEIGRAAAQDQAGAALLVGDADGDGVEDVVVGAPGSGRVVAFDPGAPPASLSDATELGHGAGRYGASLALSAPGELWIGAPGAGDDVEGALWAPSADAAAWTGPTPGAQLGFSVAAADDALLLGAPGAAGETGRVERVVP